MAIFPRVAEFFKHPVEKAKGTEIYKGIGNLIKPEPPSDPQPWDKVLEEESKRVEDLRAKRGAYRDDLLAMIKKIAAVLDCDRRDKKAMDEARKLYGVISDFLKSSPRANAELQEYLKDPSPSNFDEFKRSLDLALKADPDIPRKVCEKMGWAPPFGYVGLALSGGGIRSATFNLGVLQELAKQHRLHKFDYLSTVSGGGYIGSWLVGWIKRAKRGIAEVSEQLNPDWIEHSGKEPPEVKFLRDYSNYLTPKVGFFSADTWTMITTWLRNTILCQTVLIPAILGTLLIPRLLAWIAPSCGGKDLLMSCRVGVPLIVAMVLIARNLKLIADSLSPTAGPAQYSRFECPAWTVTLVVGFAVLGAWFASCGLWDNFAFWESVWWAPVGGAVAYSVFSLLGLIFSSMWRVVNQVERSGWGKAQFWIATVGSIPLSGALGGLLVKVLIIVFDTWKRLPGGRWLNLAFGTPLVVLVFMGTIVVHIGLIGRYLPDPLREWLSKAGAWFFVLILSWAALCGITVYGPLGVVWLAGYGKARVGALFAWLLTSLGGILAGKSASTGNPGGKSWPELLAKVSPFVFVTGLLVLLSFGVNELLPRLIGDVKLPPSSIGHLAERSSFDLYRAAHWLALSNTSNVHLLWVVPSCAILAAVLSWRVDLNEFSMHMFYRNRLVRCYLGASRFPERHPQPFTGFDPKDDLLLADLLKENQYKGPYPILNGALNLMHGSQLAWQERKAESFVMTPLFCGFEVGKQVADPCAKQSKARDEGYRPTSDYAYPGGLYLGTAMGISGAAASPNMGYHTSAPLAFLMTVFNVRLGYWLGNPRRNDKWRLAGPRFGLPYLLAELFASADDKAGHVYVSDGGHFENLGIYELVRRRCRLILACDASEDREYKFEGLGNAIRRCRDDFGVNIEINPDNLRPKDKSGKSGDDDPKKSDQHCAVGIISYDKVRAGDMPGILIYAKASLTGDEPADVLEYKNSHADFPHDSTADQWFSESQFESYRKLGQHIIDQCASVENKWRQKTRVLDLLKMDEWDGQKTTEDLSAYLARELGGVY